MHPRGEISEPSRRVAKNTLLLYFRMLLMMTIGLFTSRVIYKSLGIEDLGVYNAVAGVVMMFTVVTSSVSQAISRFIAYELGRGNKDKLSKVFSNSLFIQLVLSAILVVFVESFALWFLNHKMLIPEASRSAANWVLQCSMLIMVIQLFSIPFNATIIAHERMKAFAYISVLEAVLKLAVAFLLFFSASDKLKTYSVLMVIVALIVRSSYAAYCHRNFEESRAGISCQKALLKEMSGFAGWNFFGAAGYIFNTQGVNILVNLFFGSVANGARYFATQVENIVRQFVNNFMTAIIPGITKSYAAGDKKYCYELVFKGAKFSYLLMLLLCVPFFFEAEILLDLWLGEVPEITVIFVRLTLLGTMADLLGNSLSQLEMATGDVKRYYLIIGTSSLFVFVLSWIAFRLGAPAWISYAFFAIVYTVMLVEKLFILKSQIAFPVSEYLKEVIMKSLFVTLPTAAASAAVYFSMPQSLLRLLLVLIVSSSVLGLSSYAFAMTPGERAYLRAKLNISKS